MLNANLLHRALPIAIALTLIALTLLWGAWVAATAPGVPPWPFALCAAACPALAWAGCRRRLPLPDPHDEPVGEHRAECVRLVEH